MDKEVLFIGLDVDDKAFHVCGRARSGEIRFEFSCRPNAGVLERKLLAAAGDSELRVCYEATYLGFSLQRDLAERSIHCDVIAPSLVPAVPGDRVKTNRLDCEKLSDYYRNNQLTVVRVPGAEEEAVRDLVRARRFQTEQLKKQKQFLLSLCRRQGLNYRNDKPGANYWTQQHFIWLDGQVKQAFSPVLKFNLGGALEQVRHIQMVISSYEAQIEIISKQPIYRRKVEALCCIRGINLITAMTMITELGDINRFNHPRQITSFVGMDLCEYSSGETKRWGITKMGNRHIRTATVEAAQTTFLRPQVSKALKRRRQGADPKFIEIADRCMHRLHKKASRMIYANKNINKVKLACGRELLSFVWEALKAAA